MPLSIRPRPWWPALPPAARAASRYSSEDGFGASTDWPLISVKTLRRVRDGGTQNAASPSAYANALDMQRIAVNENVDVIVHGVWNWNEADGQQGMPAVIAQHLRNIRAKNIGYEATLRVLPGVTDSLRPDVLDDPVYKKVVPPALLTWYRTEPAQWFKHEVFGPGVRCSRFSAASRGQ